MSTPFGGKFDIAAQSFHRSKTLEELLDTSVSDAVIGGQVKETEQFEINGTFIKRDGGFLYTVGKSEQANRFTLDEFKLNTLKLQRDQELNIATNVPDNGTPLDIYFGDNGLQFFVITEYSHLFSFVAPNQWEIQHGEFRNQFDLGREDNAIQSIWFKDDGSRLYAVGEETGDLFEYSLSTTWDITSLSFTGKKFDLGFTDISGLNVQPNGQRFWVINDKENEVHDFYTDDSWNISNLSFVQKKKFDNRDQEIKDIQWTSDIADEQGTEFWLISKDSFYSYN